LKGRVTAEAPNGRVTVEEPKGYLKPNGSNRLSGRGCGQYCSLKKPLGRVSVRVRIRVTVRARARARVRVGMRVEP